MQIEVNKTSLRGFFILLGIILIGGLALFLLSQNSNNTQKSTQTTNLDINGIQNIDIKVKGGYTPNIIEAKSGVPLKLNLITNSTYDCSLSIVIPKIKYQNNLPITGKTSVDIPAQAAGTEIEGLCSMGMYNFKIKFI